MKATFFTVIKPQRDDNVGFGVKRDKIIAVEADGLYQNRPDTADGLVVKVSLDINEALLQPIEVEVKIGPEDLIDDAAIVGDLKALKRDLDPK